MQTLSPKLALFCSPATMQVTSIPFLAGSFISRDIHFFARKTLFKPGFADWILRRFNSIPVDRDGGKDVSALKRVLELLREGEGVLIFPEGTRSPDGTIQIGRASCRERV